MSVLAPVPSRQVEEMSLEEILITLSRHGRPRIGQYASSEWHCSVEMNVAAAGVSFEVKSSFNHKTPRSAAKECATRMAEALKR